MSSLFRKACGAGLTAAAVTSLGALTPAGAAEYYYQPIVQLSTAYNTNLDLSPNAADRRRAEGYFADAATNIGIATPTSETILQPRLLYNYYPTASDRNRLEAFMNLNSRYTGQRDRFVVNGFYDHRDDVNAEQPSAADTNTVNPGIGNTTPTTGRTLIGVIRDYLILDPTYTHLLTPLSGIGLATEYQRMSYSLEDPNHIAFNFYQGRLFYSKTIDLRTDLQLGVYGNRYQNKTIDSHSDSGGVQLNVGYNWSQLLRSALILQYQQTRFLENTDTHHVDEKSHPWAAEFSTTYTEETSKYSLIFGRTIFPSSAGGLYQTDQFRVQYDKDYTQRLHFTTALRVFRDQTTGGIANADYRNYATATVRGQYMLTARLFVATSYTYIYEKYRFNPNSADTNVVYLSFGYRGLDRQR